MARIIQPQSVYNRSVEVKMERPSSMYEYNPFEKLLTPQGVSTAVGVVGKVGGTIADAVDLSRRTRAAEARVDMLVKKAKEGAELSALTEQRDRLMKEGSLTPDAARKLQGRISGLERQKAMAEAGTLAEFSMGQQSYGAALAALRGARSYEEQQAAMARMQAAYDRPGSGDLFTRYSGGAQDILTKQFQRVAPPMYQDPMSKAMAKGTGAAKDGRRVGEGETERRQKIQNSPGVQNILTAGRLASSLGALPFNVGEALATNNGLLTKEQALQVVRNSGGEFELGQRVPIGEGTAKQDLYRLRTRLTGKQRQELAGLEGDVMQEALAEARLANTEKALRLLTLSRNANLPSVFETIRLGLQGEAELSNLERLGAFGDKNFSRHYKDYQVIENLLDLSAEQILGAADELALQDPRHSRYGQLDRDRLRVPIETEEEAEARTRGEVAPSSDVTALETEMQKQQAAAQAGGMRVPPDYDQAFGAPRSNMFIDPATGQQTTSDPRQRQGGRSFDEIIQSSIPRSMRRGNMPPANMDNRRVDYQIPGGPRMNMRMADAAELDEAFATPLTPEQDKAATEQIRQRIGIDPDTLESVGGADTEIPKAARKYKYRGKATKAMRKKMSRYDKYTPQSIMTTLTPPPKQEIIRIQEKARKIAEQNNVDPFLFAALIRKESGYHPLSVSSANAIGLTQMTPPAWDQIGGSSEDFDQLFNEDISLEAGAKYLKWVENDLIRRRLLTPNDPRRIQKILAGYNAGTGTLSNLAKKTDKWLATVLSPTRKARGTVGQTHKYVKDIMKDIAKAKGSRVAGGKSGG
jgi:flagellum-specific peptidoglycan hydrolase FlgJ